jgi:uncharacterized protein with NAD-binding domain and iron-sulfur cluster
MHKPIVIIGAGLAGISAALELQKAGREVLVLDANSRAGGRVQSDIIDGFTCDHGFQLINARYPELSRLNILKELDFRFSEKVVNILFEGEVHKLGDPRKYLLSAFNSETGSILEKAALLKALTVRPAIESNIAEHLQKAGLGNTYERVLKPFLRGVFLTELTNISAPVGLEILRGFISGRPGLPSGGAGKLSSLLAAKILDLRLQVTVNSIDSMVVKTSVGEIAASKIIVATDRNTAVQLLDLPSVPTSASCTTWYHSAIEAPVTHGQLIIDGASQGPVINTLVISNFIAEYAPKTKNLISSTTDLGVNESDVRRHLAKLYQGENRNWELIARYDIPTALPIGVKGIVHSIQSIVRDGIYLAGDSQVAATQNGALKSGRLAAAALLAS